jgi:DNA-binding XRE family transcriptional regulator
MPHHGVQIPVKSHLITIYDNLIPICNMVYPRQLWSACAMADWNQPHVLRQVLGLNIRVRRAELEMKQDALAHRIGTSPSHLSSIERGTRNTSMDQLQRIALALDVQPADLVTPRKSSARPEV